ncbi:MAG: AMP-binding protein [Pseudomonadota bacterium]
MEKIWLEHYPEGVEAEINPDQYPSLVEVFEEAVEKFADRPAFYNIKRHITYRELDKLSMQFANYLREDLGLKKGDVVAIMMPNCLQYPVALFGIMRAGLTVANVNPLYTPRELAHQLNDAGAKSIVIVENFASVLEQVMDQVDVDNIVTTQLADLQKQPWRSLVNFILKRVKKMVPPFSLPGAVKFNDALKLGKKHEFKRIPLTGDDLAFLQYTGGTTGVAKGAMLTHRNMVANLEQMYEWMKPRIDEAGNEIIISPLPMYHIFCMTVNVLAFMKLGGLNVLISNPRDINMFVKIMSKFKFSAITCVNTLFNQLVHDENFRTKCDFSNVKIAVGGGMAIQESVARKWHEITGEPILEGFGMTETSPVVSTSPVLDIPVFSGSIGVPLPSTECSIRDDDGKELPLGEAGELCVRGPQVMKGYWNRPEATAESMTKDGFLKTGDVAVMDERGFMKIVDRKKDMILVSGFNVYPNEIENVLTLHDGILEAAAIGVPDEKSGEVVKVFVVLEPGHKLSKDEVIAHCRANMTGYKVPKQVVFADDLPKSNVGKILRKELR